jgi:hypothetical protein
MATRDGYGTKIEVNGVVLPLAADPHFPDAVPPEDFRPLEAFAHIRGALAPIPVFGPPDFLPLPPDAAAPPPVPWDTPPHATPLADLRAVAGAARDLGAPIPGRLFLPPDFFAPAVADLTGDPACVAILRAWARRPWKPEHHAALCDRMEELGLEAQAARVRQWALPDGRPDLEWNCLWTWHLWKRRRRGRMLPLWHDQLSKWFGDFEVDTFARAARDTPLAGR